MAEAGNPWKVIAIVFIILFVVETIFGIWILLLGDDILDKESECSINVCGALDGAVSYLYDDIEQICTCLDATGSTVKQQFLG